MKDVSVMYKSTTNTINITRSDPNTKPQTSPLNKHLMSFDEYEEEESLRRTPERQLGAAAGQ